MAFQKRLYRARPVVKRVRSHNTGLIYDSKLEMQLHDTGLSDFEFHNTTYKYTIEHTYHPDFTYKVGDMTYVIEVKGFFADTAEAAKYKWIALQLGEDYELVFVFSKPDTPLPWSKKRKDGTRMTHADWAVRNKFRYFDPSVTKEDILCKKQ